MKQPTVPTESSSPPRRKGASNVQTPFVVGPRRIWIAPAILLTLLLAASQSDALATAPNLDTKGPDLLLPSSEDPCRGGSFTKDLSFLEIVCLDREAPIVWFRWSPWEQKGDRPIGGWQGILFEVPEGYASLDIAEFLPLDRKNLLFVYRGGELYRASSQGLALVEPSGVSHLENGGDSWGPYYRKVTHEGNETIHSLKTLSGNFEAQALWQSKKAEILEAWLDEQGATLLIRDSASIRTPWSLAMTAWFGSA